MSEFTNRPVHVVKTTDVALNDQGFYCVQVICQSGSIRGRAQATTREALDQEITYLLGSLGASCPAEHVLEVPDGKV
jgi:hypothetical protein